MAFEGVYLVSVNRVLTTEAELEELQKWLRALLPLGYREYMTTLGAGTYCDFVQVFPPSQIRKTRVERQEFIREYYDQLWGEFDSSLVIEQAVTAIPFANTCDGDEIYFLPDQNRLFVLPRHDNFVCWMESGFLDPLDWRTKSRRSGIEEPAFRYFEPSGDARRCIEFFTSGTFDLHAVAERCRARWSSQEVRSILNTHCVLLFPQAIQGRIQLTQASGDRRVGIRVDYGEECSAEVERFAADLVGMGFFERWRHPPYRTSQD